MKRRIVRWGILLLSCVVDVSAAGCFRENDQPTAHPGAVPVVQSGSADAGGVAINVTGDAVVEGSVVAGHGAAHEEATAVVQSATAGAGGIAINAGGNSVVFQKAGTEDGGTVRASAGESTGHPY